MLPPRGREIQILSSNEPIHVTVVTREEKEKRKREKRQSKGKGKGKGAKVVDHLMKLMAPMDRT